MTQVHHIPQGNSPVTANIVVDGGLDALAFYERAFGAEVLMKLVHEGRLMHGEIRIGEGVVSVTDSMPEYGVAAPDPDGPVHTSLTVWTPDAAALHARVVAAGGTEISPVTDEFHGDRVGAVRCPYGHRWIISTHIEDVDEAEMQRRMDAWLAQASSEPR